MNLMRRLRGKVQAARTLAGIARSCRNWPSVWAAWRGLEPTPELILRSGLRVAHGPEDQMIALFREIFLAEDYTCGGFYRPRAGDTVIDLGANIGTFAVYLQHRARGVHVHCFEPGADTRLRLEHNMKINNINSLIKVYPFGVSDVSGRLALHGHRFAGSRSTLASASEAEGGCTESIECVTLAKAIRMTGVDRVDLLKIDVEGAEVDVLAERDPATWAKVRRVVLEFHGSVRPGARESVTASLKACGFRVLRVIETSPGAADGVLQAIR